MPITQIDLDAAENLLRELLGNRDAAEEYSKDPQGWLKSNGYDNVSPEAVQQCAVSYPGAGGAATAAHAATSGVAGVAAAVNPVVYNHYYEVDNSVDNSVDIVDNSITNNILNTGDLDFDQTIQQGDGNVAVGGNVNDSQIQTGSGIQAGDDVDIDDSNVATGDDNQQAIDDSINVTGDGNQTAVDQQDTDIDVEADLGLRGDFVRGPLNGETNFDDPS
jgi:hypothetical protein